MLSKKRSMLSFVVLLIPMVALIMVISAPMVWADEIELEEAEFNIEFNSTDNDLGVRAFADGEPYDELKIEDADGNVIAKFEGKEGMKLQGFAELFYESGEPTLTQVSVPTFLGRFPEGTYEFTGETIEGDEIVGDTEFTHVIPCGPEIEAEIVDSTVVISWEDPETVVDPVATGNGSEEVCVPPGSLGQTLTIVAYEIILESDESELIFKFEADGDTELAIPLSLLEEDTEYDYEVIVIEDSGNQTITEDDFCTGECEEED